MLAVPLFVTGLVTGGFVSSVVAAAAVMLWFQPARDWFDGVVREPQPTGRSPDRSSRRRLAAAAAPDLRTRPRPRTRPVPAGSSRPAWRASRSRPRLAGDPAVAAAGRGAGRAR